MEEHGESNREAVRLWRVWKTARQMCQDRGYEILDDEINVSFDDWAHGDGQRPGFVDPTTGAPLRDLLTFTLRPTADMIEKLREPKTARNPDPPSSCGEVVVMFNGEPNLGVKPIKGFIQEVVNKRNAFSGILITTAAPTPTSLKLTGTLNPKDNIVEIFQESELVVNITLHELVPKHQLLSNEEKAELLKRYRLKESQLPRIQRTDPVAKYLGLRRGQVVKIIRKSETAGRYASYRWCI